MSDRRFLGSLDQGTTSTRFVIYDAATLEVVTSAQQAFPQYTPAPGWVEHNPTDLLESSAAVIDEAMSKLSSIVPGSSASNVSAVGITNQRETAVAWSRTSSAPLHNAIVWNDARTSHLASSMSAALGGPDALRTATGLPISCYFTALKLRWLLDNSADVRAALQSGDLAVGTVDSWLLWGLCSAPGEQVVHCTDSSNASRTLLVALASPLAWDDGLLKTFGLESMRSALPQIRPSVCTFGVIRRGALAGVPICGVAGDQQAALLGHGGFDVGAAKATFGTGCFVLRNAGLAIPKAARGLVGTVLATLPASQWNHDGSVGGSGDVTDVTLYAEEGSISTAGSLIKWLIDNLQCASSVAEVESLAQSVSDTGGVSFVPAFGGLLAPYWQPAATGTIVGLSLSTTRAHICRAALEAVAMQAADVVDAMGGETANSGAILNADGGMAVNRLFLQMLADASNLTVRCPPNPEVTALGATVLAGLGCGAFRSVADAKRVVLGRTGGCEHSPLMADVDRVRVSDFSISHSSVVAMPAP